MHTLINKRSYRRVILSVSFLILLSLGFTERNHPAASTSINLTESAKSAITAKLFLYDKLGLEAMGLSREAFSYALNGLNNLLNAGKIRKENILSILDFSLPSGKKRLFIIDLELGQLVFNTYVSHGKNSGKEIPTDFSNQDNSNKSSLGFFVTGETYIGKHGCSLRLEGEEKGINNNAASRGIVMHSAEYVSEKIAKCQGYIGRSQGCPALPPQLSKNIINKIKNGSCLFIYSPDKNYSAHSKMIQGAA
jgi:hypothetical protein